MNPLDLDPEALAEALDREGYAVTPPVLLPSAAARMQSMFEDDSLFRNTVDMARVQFGRGRYRYFDRPLPDHVGQLRRELYAALAPIANVWRQRLGETGEDWPPELEGLTARCRDAGQTRPTPLLLRYRPGDFNCLHRDLYGEVHFPLQAIVMLSDPDRDFEGGELVLVEQRPRLQSRPAVVQIPRGAAAIIPVSERPRPSARGWSRSFMRHGVSAIRSGERYTLGIIFHDAA